jgi:hypothetical protein
MKSKSNPYRRVRCSLTSVDLIVKLMVVSYQHSATALYSSIDVFDDLYLLSLFIILRLMPVALYLLSDLINRAGNLQRYCCKRYPNVHLQVHQLYSVGLSTYTLQCLLFCGMGGCHG